MIASLFLPLALLAAEPDMMPVSEKYAAHDCTVRGVLTTDGVTVLRCANPTAEGISQFAVERGEKRFENLQRDAAWALKEGRPLGVLYSTDPTKNRSGCMPETCRSWMGAELR